MWLRLGLLAVLCFGCTDRPVHEDPKVDPNPNTGCGVSARLVRDICTRLGPTDGCVETDDVCVALCDHRSRCTTVGELRVVNGFATAPDGYCVECVE